MPVTGSATAETEVDPGAPNGAIAHLFDKIWDSRHHSQGEGTYLLYIDLHLIHEVTTPQAFEGLRAAGRKVRRPDATIAVSDHNIPTSNRSAGIDEPESKLQVDTLEQNVRDFGVPYFPIDSINQGIVHIIGRSRLSQPGMTIVCATATRRRMARWARWPSASAPPRSSMCWPLRR